MVQCQCVSVSVEWSVFEWFGVSALSGSVSVSVFEWSVSVFEWSVSVFEWFSESVSKSVSQ